MTEPNENIAPGRGTATRTSESDEGKASGRGIMSLDAVRRLAWTAIVLFIMAIVFAFNHGPILAWLAANHTPLLVGILQAPLWFVAFLLIVLGLQCWLDIVEVDKTPFAIILHALGIMLCIGWWGGRYRTVSPPAGRHRRVRPDGRLYSHLRVRMDHGPASNDRQGDFPEATRPDSRLRGRVYRQQILSEEQG